MKKMSILQVFGKRWFSRGPGNTYHSAEIHVDGQLIHKIEFAYGYGDQYEWNASLWLEDNGYLPGRTHSSNGSREALWRYCERMGIQYYRSATDVQRKKDL